MTKKNDNLVNLAPDAVTEVEEKTSTKMIEVTQLPIIEEHLQEISVEILAIVTEALELPVTDDTVTTVKKKIAYIRKKFNELETQRKNVKRTILTPYDEFEKLYKKYITDIITNALSDLNEKVAKVTDARKEEKRQKAFDFFEEYRETKGIDFITFEELNLNITLSVSDKKLRETCKAYVDKVVEDLTLIDTQDNKEEILYEYKQSKNVSQAINLVVSRHKAIEQENKKVTTASVIEQAESDEQKRAIVNKAISETEEIAVPEEESENGKEIATPEEEIKTLGFYVYGTFDQLKAVGPKIKMFLGELVQKGDIHHYG